MSAATPPAERALRAANTDIGVAFLLVGLAALLLYRAGDCIEKARAATIILEAERDGARARADRATANLDGALEHIHDAGEDPEHVARAQPRD